MLIKYDKYKNKNFKLNLKFGGSGDEKEIKNIKNIIETSIKKYFSEDYKNDDIIIYDNSDSDSNLIYDIYNINIICENDELNTTKFSLNFNKEDKEDIFIEIENLSRCITNSRIQSGTKILNNIINIGKELKIKFITLTDASFIYENTNCEIDLAYYMILLYGESWYNRFGFKSQYYKKENAHNNSMINKTFQEYIDKCIYNNRFYYYKNNNKDRLKLEEYDNERKLNGHPENIIMEKILSINEIISKDIKICDIMSILHSIIKSNIECNDIIFLVKEFIDISKNTLKYHPKLFYYY
jgi:hypothetical protein